MDCGEKHLHNRNMSNIPTYALYGEHDSAQDWLHWETIPDRSQKHDFFIAPHRHEHLLQVLLLTRGRAEVVLDGNVVSLSAGTVVVVPALVVHGYQFSENVDGIVLTLFERDVREQNFAFEGATVITSGVHAVQHAMERLIDEADRPGQWHDIAMRAQLTLLLIALHRAARPTDDMGPKADRARQYAAAYQSLVEQRFRKTRRIADYASELGMTPTHLNRICRQTFGSSALAVIERRIALEARRQLLFSTLSIKQIGAELGYDDPAYFTRFITPMLGMSPSQFRQTMSRA
jgi:AraC family transcriptional activator of pobA